MQRETHMSSIFIYHRAKKNADDKAVHLGIWCNENKSLIDESKVTARLAMFTNKYDQISACNRHVFIKVCICRQNLFFSSNKFDYLVCVCVGDSFFSIKLNMHGKLLFSLYSLCHFLFCTYFPQDELIKVNFHSHQVESMKNLEIVTICS